MNEKGLNPGCEKCGGRKKNYPHPGEPDCFHCDDLGTYSPILAKNYDHPCHRPHGIDEFFGYDVEKNRARVGKEPWDKKEQWIKEEHEYHYQTYQCCPSCHFSAHLWKDGHDVRRDLKKHMMSGKCLGSGMKK